MRFSFRQAKLPALPGGEWGAALTDAEIGQIRAEFGGLPSSLERVLRAGAPLGPDYPEWRSPAAERARFVEEMTRDFVASFERGDHRPVIDSSRSEAENLSLVLAGIRSRPLIRIHLHRYMPALDGQGWPIMSIMMPYDCAVLGHDVLEYFAWGRKHPIGWRAPRSSQARPIEEVPFWSEVLEI